MVGAGADIHLEFAADADKTLGAHTVLKVVIERFVEGLAIDAKLLQESNILCSFTADTFVITLEVASVVAKVLVLELTDGSNKAFWASASQVTVDSQELQRYVCKYTIRIKLKDREILNDATSQILTTRPYRHLHLHRIVDHCDREAWYRKHWTRPRRTRHRRTLAL
jgi:hypothetical protein